MYAELELKICRTCNKPEEKKEFKRMSLGKVIYQLDCRVCRKEKERVRGLMRFYGVTPEQYDEMFSQQGGKCACCGTNPEDFKRKFHVDHNRETGQVRALLCTQCNPGIGFFEHSIKRLEMAIKYLEKFKK